MYCLRLWILNSFLFIMALILLLLCQLMLCSMTNKVTYDFSNENKYIVSSEYSEPIFEIIVKFVCIQSWKPATSQQIFFKILIDQSCIIHSAKDGNSSMMCLFSEYLFKAKRLFLEELVGGLWCPLKHWCFEKLHSQNKSYQQVWKGHWHHLE